MFGKPPARADRAPENDTGVCHGRGDDLRIVGFFCDCCSSPRLPGLPSLKARQVPDRRSPATFDRF